MDNELQQQQIMGALGYPVMALPQQVVKTPKTEYAVQRTQYDPVKLQAVMTALQKPRSLKSRGEIIAEALANVPEARSFTGGFGEEIINPWGMALSSFARSFGNAYKAKKEDERAKELEDRENALKAAQLDLEANKAAVTEKYINDYMKVNDPKAKTAEQQAQEIQQRESAKGALKDLVEISKGGIGGWNNEADSRWNSSKTAKLLGRREQDLSALIPLTNAIAKASGGSGINTLGEMLAYVGLPENATSAQIRGALPGLIDKLGFSPDEIYEQSPVVQNQDGSYTVNGFTIRVKK